MGNWQFRVRGILAVLIVVAPLTLLSCDDSDPVGPPDVPEPPKDYAVYMPGAFTSNQVLRYYPVSGRLDTLDTPSSGEYGIAVTPDGSRLYLNDRGFVLVVDVQTLEQIARLEYFALGPAAISPDGSLVAFAGDGIYMLRTSDFSVIFSDTSRSSDPEFSSDGRWLYCNKKVDSNNRHQVFRVDVTSDPPSGRVLDLNTRSVSQVLPTPDGERLVLYTSEATFVWGFHVYDFASDSIIYSFIHAPGEGQLSMSPDGRYVFFGEPSGGIPGPLECQCLRVFDLEKLEMMQFGTEEIVPGYPRWLDIGPSVVTPDSRWLIAAEGHLGDSFLIFDIGRMAFTTFIDSAGEYVGHPAVQSTP